MLHCSSVPNLPVSLEHGGYPEQGTYMDTDVDSLCTGKSQKFYAVNNIEILCWPKTDSRENLV